GIRISKDGIPANRFLNQDCASVLGLELMLLRDPLKSFFNSIDPYRSSTPTDQSQPRLLRDHASRCRWGRRLFGRRDHECDPGVPSVGPVLVGEFPVAFEIEVGLRRGAQGNNESELRTHADNLRLEAADAITGAAVAADLFVHIAHHSNLKLL